MPQLILIRGNSGSGKSTLARALQREIGRNTLLIPQDIIRRELLWVHDGIDNEAIPLLQAMLRYGHEHCDVTILEGILKVSWYRPLFDLARELYGADLHAYYYDLPFEETVRRHETRDKRAEFGEADMRRWWNERDLLGDIPETLFDASWSLDAALLRVLKDLWGSSMAQR